MTFEDDFSSFSASATGSGTTWQDLYPYGGEAAHDLSGNSEAEYYSSALPGQYNSPFSDGNGVLTISAFPAPGGSDPYNLPYTSGVITTAQSFAQTYGYFEIDAKLPSGQGLWPAFWMLPTNGYTAELDDFEIVNNTNTIFSTVHGTTNGSWGSNSQAFPSPDLSASFNVFGFNWTPTTVTYYLNGVEYGSAPTPQSMDSPMFMLLNLAVGGNGSWPGAPNSSTVFPANMQIAWVQAYATPDTTYVGGSAAIPAGSTYAAVPAVTSAVASTVTATVTTTAATVAAVTPSNPAPVTYGSGPDTLTIVMAEDYYLGDAQFTVSVDGVQQGGTYTTTALKNLSESQSFNIDGAFSPGAHTVTVDFLNDAWGGSAATDRNLYVLGATLDGAAVAVSTLDEYSSGAQTFPFTEPGTPATTAATSSVTTSTTPAATSTVSTNPAPVTIGSGPDTLTLQLSEDAYLGNAAFTISVDGIQQGGTYSTTALRDLGQNQTFTIDGTFAAGANTVTVDYLNDLYGGTLLADRNLYLDGALINGAPVPGASLTEYNAGAQSLTFDTDPALAAGQPAAVAIPGGASQATPDTVTIALTEDAYAGNAQAAIAIDGATLATPTVTFLNSGGISELFTYTGDFGGAGISHNVAISFLNDLYGGSAAADRNLHVQSVTFDGVTTPDQTTLYNNGTISVTVPASSSTLPTAVKTS
jgi:beta-glucanase (GH16 family)